MKTLYLLISITLVSGLIPGPSLAFPLLQREVLVFRRATVIDGVSARPRQGVTVVVRDGRIESVGSSAHLPAGARIIDLGGRWLLPGFIDAHVHLRDIDSARTALRSGVTTARSLGVSGFADIDIRERHRAGASDLPDVIASGYHVRRRLAADLFVTAPELRHLAAGLSGAEDIRLVVGMMVGRGVDVIKVMATERAGLPETDPFRRVLTNQELVAAVGAAKNSNIPVAAHAHSDEGARSAVLAGVRTIEHGTMLSAGTLALMRQRGTCLVPTISFWKDMLDPGGEYDHPELAARASKMLPRIRQVTAMASKMGVKVAAGSDMRYDASSTRNLASEIADLIEAGLPPMDAIKAATSRAAQCLGVGRRTGSIMRGLEADLIVLDRDPLRNPGAFRDPLLVVNDGRIALDRLSTATRPLRRSRIPRVSGYGPST